MRRFDLSMLKAISKTPDEGRGEWLSQAEDAVAFLKDVTQSDEIILYANAPAVVVIHLDQSHHRVHFAAAAAHPCPLAFYACPLWLYPLGMRRSLVEQLVFKKYL